MIWFAIGLLAVAALAPLMAVLERNNSARGAQALAMSLHRTQLAELDRDLAEGRILPAEHQTAVLEVQRRLLAAAERPERAVRTGSRAPLIAALLLVPVAAVGLYMVGGSPDMPSVLAGSRDARQNRFVEEAALIAQLRERLVTLDPKTDQARQGYVLLGNVEASRGNAAAAAQAWRVALADKFDPVLAVRTAEASIRAEGTLSSQSEGLLRRALAAAAADAPWRPAVEDMLKQATP